MYPQVWNRVVSGGYKSDELLLEGYERRSVKGELYPALIPNASKHVSGRVYWSVNPKDRERLDAFEGEEYRRTPVTIIHAGKWLTVQVYLWRQSCNSLLSAKEWDPVHFETVGLKQFLMCYCGFKVVE